MKRICVMIFFTLVMQFGTSVFGQVPAAPQPVQLVPLVDFSLVFNTLFAMFGPHHE